MIYAKEIKFKPYQEKRYNHLPAERQIMFTKKYRKERKKVSITYLLWFFTGFHYAYLNRWDKCFLYLATFGGLCFWMLWDMFTIPKKVKQYNEELIDELIYEFTPF